MRLCFIIGTINYSGAEKVLSIVMKKLANMGDNVSVILLEKPYGKAEVIDGITAYGAKATGNRVDRILKRGNYIRECVDEAKPDVVVAFGFVCNINTLLALFTYKIPKVICERNDPNYDPRKLSQKIERAILYRTATGYVFQTDTIRRYFDGYIKNKKNAVIANPIVDNGLRWNQEKAEERIVTVARLDDIQKDQYTLMKAFEKFHEKHNKFVLEIYGAGPDENAYREYIQEHNMGSYILLKGKTSEPQKNMLTARAFILTSKFEGMPNALMEAMSIGIPCISTDCGGGGAKALFNIQKESGILTEVGNVDAIAEALDRVISNSGLQKRLSHNCIAINEFAEGGVIAKQWKTFLETLQQ